MRKATYKGLSAWIRISGGNRYAHVYGPEIREGDIVWIRSCNSSYVIRTTNLYTPNSYDYIADDGVRRLCKTCSSNIDVEIVEDDKWTSDLPTFTLDERREVAFVRLTEPPRVRYSCPHCHRSWASKYSENRHRRECWSNPKNRTCLTCVHNEDLIDCAVGAKDLGGAVVGWPRWVKTDCESWEST